MAEKRIMTHMNKEHSDDLERYLRAFNAIPASGASGAQLTGLTLDTLTIQTTTGASHTVSVKPPMRTFADARERLIAMAVLARSELGLPPADDKHGNHDDDDDVRVRMDRFTPPHGVGIVSFIGVSFYFLSAASVFSGALRPGTGAWDFLNAWYPLSGAGGFSWLVRTIAIPVLGIHLYEAGWMARSRLAVHGVPFGSALWFAWVFDTFVEGYPAFQRFDGLVKEARAKKAAASH